MNRSGAPGRSSAPRHVPRLLRTGTPIAIGGEIGARGRIVRPIALRAICRRLVSLGLRLAAGDRTADDGARGQPADQGRAAAATTAITIPTMIVTMRPAKAAAILHVRHRLP